MKDNKFTLEADIKIVEETDALRKAAASIVEFPKNKTTDLMFFSGIFVSSGENLNHAFFMPSELIKAVPSINNKAIDIEHKEDQIVGHIFSNALINRKGATLSIEDLGSLDETELNKMDIDVVIAGIIYKSRFPELAKEISDSKWKLSMETYFQDYDVKIDNIIMSRKEAEALGFVNSWMGKLAKVIKNGKELSSGSVSRVLRSLLFSGCGVVKNPANPRSVVLETAKKQLDGDTDIVINMDDIHNNKDSNMSDNKDMNKVDGEGVKVVTDKDKEDADVDTLRQTSVGICVNFRRRVIDATYEGPDVKVLHENWCTLYDRECTSFSRDVTDPNCLRRVAERESESYAKAKMDEFVSKDKRKSLLSELELVLLNTNK